MSYRTYINGHQIFGNHERYPEWLEFIASQGIKINEDDNYEGEITDFMGALIVIENITLRLEKERRDRKAAFEKEMEEKNFTDKEKEVARSTIYGIKSMFDWSNTPIDLEHENQEDKFHTSLFDKLNEIINNGYAFMPIVFFKACEDKLEEDKCFSTNGHFECYKLKEGETLHVKAS